MGQGLHTKMVQVCATALGIPLSDIHISKTSTDTSANEPPTAASLSSDRFGLAILDACQQVTIRNFLSYSLKSNSSIYASNLTKRKGQMQALRIL